MWNLNRLLSIADRVAIREGLQRKRTGAGGRGRELGQPIGRESPRLGSKDDLPVEVPVLVVRDNGGALRHIGPGAAQVIEVVVRVNEVPDRLVGDGLLDLRNHGVRALLVERSLDNRDEVLELD